MSTAKKNRAVTFQASKELVAEAMEVLSAKNLTLSYALRLFLQNIVVTHEIGLLSEEELERERLFKQLQSEVKQSIDDYEAGKGISLEEARAHFGL